MVTFLHSSDWQLGMMRRFLGSDAQARYGQARIDAIERLGELAARAKASFVVVAGDVFETNQVDRQVVLRAIEALRAVPCPVYLLPGNHDPLCPGSVWASAALAPQLPDHVEVLSDTAPRTPVAGVEVVGVPWRTLRPALDPVLGEVGDPQGPRLDQPETGNLRVVVGHGQVDTLAPAGDGDTPAVALAGLESAVAAGCVHYVALGDRHSTTSVGTTGRIWYSGTPEPTRPEEQDPGQVLRVDLTSDGCVTTPMSIGTWRMLSEVVEVDDDAGLRALERRLADQPDKSRTVLRLGVRGSLGLASYTRLEMLLEAQAEVFAAIHRWDRHWDVTLRPDDADLTGLRLSGPARSALHELRDATVEGDPEAADALALLHRLASSTGSAA